MNICAVSAAPDTIAGGLALLAGIIRFPLEQLQGTLSIATRFPGLILAFVVEESSHIAPATLFFHRELVVLCSATAGLIFAGSIVCEVILLGQFALVWEGPFFVWGVVIFGLADYLWMTEYRSYHLTGHGSLA